MKMILIMVTAFSLTGCAAIKTRVEACKEKVGITSISVHGSGTVGDASVRF